MSVTTQGYVPKDITLNGASNIAITNINIITINTEVSHSLQSNLKLIIIRNRDKGVTKISFNSGESSTKYLTIQGGSVFTLDNITFASETIYLQSDKLSIVEIVELYS